jgi:hypothetical protein
MLPGLTKLNWNYNFQDINTIIYSGWEPIPASKSLFMKSISLETATQLNEKSFTELDKLFFSTGTMKGSV